MKRIQITEINEKWGQAGGRFQIFVREGKVKEEEYEWGYDTDNILKRFYQLKTYKKIKIVLIAPDKLWLTLIQSNEKQSQLYKTQINRRQPFTTQNCVTLVY